jgi:hypothetical protein
MYNKCRENGRKYKCTRARNVRGRLTDVSGVNVQYSCLKEGIEDKRKFHSFLSNKCRLN